MNGETVGLWFVQALAWWLVLRVLVGVLTQMLALVGLLGGMLQPVGVWLRWLWHR